MHSVYMFYGFATFLQVLTTYSPLTVIEVQIGVASTILAHTQGTLPLCLEMSPCTLG